MVETTWHWLGSTFFPLLHANFFYLWIFGGIFACTALFKSFHSIWIGFWSRLWLGNSRTLNFLGRLTEILQVIVTLKGSLSVHLQSSNKWSRFILNIFLHNEEFSIMVNCPDYDAGKQPKTITFPQPCFTTVIQVFCEMLSMILAKHVFWYFDQITLSLPLLSRTHCPKNPGFCLGAYKQTLDLPWILYNVIQIQYANGKMISNFPLSSYNKWSPLNCDLAS